MCYNCIPAPHCPIAVCSWLALFETVVVPNVGSTSTAYQYSLLDEDEAKHVIETECRELWSPCGNLSANLVGYGTRTTLAY